MNGTLLADRAAESIISIIYHDLFVSDLNHSLLIQFQSLARGPDTLTARD